MVFLFCFKPAQTATNLYKVFTSLLFFMSEFWFFGSYTEFPKTSVTELYLTHHMWSPHNWSKVVVPDG